jgi:large exoprotein involved in heme utilization and adhesion
VLQGTPAFVTSPEASRIDGTLQSDASLFLLNPQGVIFGPRARLDINGSFHTSTADVLRFADGSTFSTRLSEKSTLTVASPSAFGFWHDHPASIEVQGSELAVPEGATLGMVGGDIAIVGDGDPASGAPNLSVPGGRMTLASVASSGDVVLNPGGDLSTFDMTSFAQLGAISMSEGARVDVSGEGGGTIVIRSGQLRIDSSWLVADTLGRVDGDEVGIDIAVLVMDSDLPWQFRSHCP